MRSPEIEKTPEVLIGAPAKEVVKEILRENPQIPFLTLLVHNLKPKGWEELDVEEKCALDDVKRMKVYRDAVLDDLQLEDLIVGLGVFDENREWEELSCEKFSETIKRAEDDWPLAEFLTISSRVELPEPRHIPMLDFECPKTGGNLNAILRGLRAQGQKGFILDSGNSFHFWGINLLFESGMLPEYEWRTFLIRNRENPFVDKRFVEVSLKNGFTCLRITETAERDIRTDLAKKPTPRMIAIL
ncbi:MAG TPA: hypothetical protein VMX76_03030 [Nevskiaceae bacterium]|nr:hypothetical protein [Nevskiaceae bacterium]